ncbi:PrpF domain-containing protein [Polynucleobacter sp.]|uniref:2-methylaconitate cis-trans isomerase PrpF family protein n=1 Tax=Polynucleobacter sp. TaxID=2029855 RepID=UPI00333F5914
MTDSFLAVTAVDSPELIPVRATLMRGGSSKGLYFLGSDLPAEKSMRDAVLLASYGSPDARQVDGLGGADPLTSKAAIVDVSERDDADVEYTFCQVGIEDAAVSTGGNCGNMLSGVGAFAILRSLVKGVDPITTVRIFTTNTQQVVIASIPTQKGMPIWDGDCSIAGVPDTGATIRLDFGDCSGAVSGKLLPTGRSIDMVQINHKEIPLSLIDAATPFVFVRASDIGVTGYETPDQMRNNSSLMATLEQVRSWAAVQLGIVSNPEEALAKSPNVPRVMMIAPAADYETPRGKLVSKADADVCVRQLSMQKPHKALAVTGAACAAVASAVPGSLLQQLVGGVKDVVRLGHPSGVLRVAAQSKLVDGQLTIQSAQIERTCRLLMDGFVYVRKSKIQTLLQGLK